MTDPEDPGRRLAGDAAAAFETGVQFLSELQKRFLAQGEGDPLETILARVGVFADRGRAATSPGSARAAELVVKGLSPEALERFRVASGARAMDSAQYLTALVDLHEAMRRLADTGEHPEVEAVLRRLRLGTVTA